MARLRQIIAWLAERRNRQWIAVGLLMIALLIAVVRFLRFPRGLSDPRNEAFIEWWTASYEKRLELVTARREVCPGAPFLLPSDGYIGLLYGDPRPPYTDSHRHQGIDIFSPGDIGETPVYAAYDGYLTREVGWLSAVIIRIPDDPLYPGRQIWLYYTHMADPSGEKDTILDDFPPGTQEVFVKQGTLLGYTGNYSGRPFNPVGVHLHFSVVLDNGQGRYRNELEFDNTVDPSRYLGMSVNYGCAPVVPECTLKPVCSEAIQGKGGT
jgi:murein DD-endopeptidase MepM/ murein hydrolase activator NlpD